MGRVSAKKVDCLRIFGISSHQLLTLFHCQRLRDTIHHTIQTRNRNMKIKLSLQCLSMSVSVWYKHKAFNLSFRLEKACLGQKFDAKLLV